MTWKDVIYLEQARKIKRKEDFEEKKIFFENDQENIKRINLLMMDIRQIVFDNLCFDNTSAKERYYRNLPSVIEYTKPEDRMKFVAKGHGVKKVKKKESEGPE